MTEPTEDSVRADVRAWLKDNWSPELGLVEWRLKLCDSGWGAPHWPIQSRCCGTTRISKRKPPPTHWS